MPPPMPNICHGRNGTVATAPQVNHGDVFDGHGGTLEEIVMHRRLTNHQHGKCFHNATGRKGALRHGKCHHPNSHRNDGDVVQNGNLATSRGRVRPTNRTAPRDIRDPDVRRHPNKQGNASPPDPRIHHIGQRGPKLRIRLQGRRLNEHHPELLKPTENVLKKHTHHTRSQCNEKRTVFVVFPTLTSSMA